MHRTTGALATKPRPTPMPERPPLARAHPPNLAGAVQGSLFTPNVIAMPSRGVQPDKAPGGGTRANARPRTAASTTATRSGSRRGSRGPVEGQGQLEFLEPAQPKARTLGTTVEAKIFCEAPVATPMHRALAAALDWTMVLIAYGVFLSTFVLCGGEFIINRANLSIFGGALAIIACAYGLFWTIAGTETVGMRWTHLRLITFEGFPPETSQRLMRLAGSCLSIFSVLGAFWSLADEESLGWQDHMSRTFPTPNELDSQVFRRR